MSARVGKNVATNSADSVTTEKAENTAKKEEKEEEGIKKVRGRPKKQVGEKAEAVTMKKYLGKGNVGFAIAFGRGNTVQHSPRKDGNQQDQEKQIEEKEKIVIMSGLKRTKEIVIWI